MVFRAIFDDVMEQGREMCVTYIDYSAAFHSVSHKYLDKALQNPTPPLNPDSCSEQYWQSRSHEGREHQRQDSHVTFFSNKERVVQGDITSPLYFILALELQLLYLKNMTPTHIKHFQT